MAFNGAPKHHGMQEHPASNLRDSTMSFRKYTPYHCRLGVIAASAWCIGVALYTLFCGLYGPPYRDAYGMMVRASVLHVGATDEADRKQRFANEAKKWNGRF